MTDPYPIPIHAPRLRPLIRLTCAVHGRVERAPNGEALPPCCLRGLATGKVGVGGVGGDGG